MHTDSTRRRILLRLPLLAIAAVLAIGSSGASLALASSSTVLHQAKKKPPHKKILNLAGTWTGQYGGTFSGTFTLTWKQTGVNLSGTIVLKGSSNGSYSVTGTVKGSAISFGAVSVGATYTGSVSGKSMSGNYNTPGGGGTWSATET